MSAELAQGLPGEQEARSATRSPRARIVLALGPATAVVGIVWALLQPWRLTLLHPHGQGFWWLFAEPPVYVVLVGILFRLLIAPGVVDDLEAEE
jgi:hypothetical protein